MRGLERLQAAARFDQQVGGETWRERVLGNGACGASIDVGAGEADDQAGHGVITQIELGGLSFTERACKSRGHRLFYPAHRPQVEGS